jgi:hypothetical protein
MKYLSIILILYLFTACQETTDFLGKARKINGEPVLTDCMIGRPSSILYVESQKLLLQDRYEKLLMTLIDLSNSQCVRFLQEGNGPDDVMPGFKSFVSTGNMTLGVYQFQSGILNQYDLNNMTVENASVLKVKTKFMIEETPQAGGLISVGSYFIGIGMFEKGRVHLYDQEGKFITEGGVYPFNGEDIDAQSRFFAYQSYIASDNEHNFVVASAYGDNLEFYEIEEGNNIILKRKYETHDTQFSIQEGMLKLEDNCLMGYKGAWGGKQYCYLLFSGKTFAENNHKTFGANYILVFTWDGRFVKSYETNTELLSFCVNEKEGIVYALAKHEDEMTIIKFVL